MYNIDNRGNIKKNYSPSKSFRIFVISGLTFAVYDLSTKNF